MSFAIISLLFLLPLLLTTTLIAKVTAVEVCTSSSNKYYYTAEIELFTPSQLSCSSTEKESIGRFLDAAFDTVGTAGVYQGPIDLKTDICTSTYPKVYKCCSWDFKSCGSNQWCSSVESNCEGSCAGAYINPLETTQCKALWTSCSTDNECCGSSECFLHEDGWKGCEPYFHGLKPGYHEPGWCCSNDFKNCKTDYYCNFRAENCVRCKGFYIQEKTASTSCKARYTSCSSSTECCPGTVCVLFKTGVKQCNNTSTYFPKRRLGNSIPENDHRHEEVMVDIQALMQEDHQIPAAPFDILDLDVRRELLTPVYGWVVKGGGRCRLCPADNGDRREMQELKEMSEDDKEEGSVNTVRKLLTGNGFTAIENELKISLDIHLTKSIMDRYKTDRNSCLYGKAVDVKVQLTQELLPTTGC